jgi:hypothetical protein
MVDPVGIVKGLVQVVMETKKRLDQGACIVAA